MILSIKDNISSVAANLRKIRNNQLPFAISEAVNMTANDIAKQQRALAQRVFDRPTPFLLNGIFAGRSFKGIRAKKFAPTALLVPGSRFGRLNEAGRRVNQVIHRQTYGGIRTPSRTAIVVPTRKASVNRYGNLRNQAVKKLLNQKNVVVLGDREGFKPGIFRRRGDRLEFLVAFEKFTKYQKRFPYFEIAEATARNVAKSNFRVAYIKAVRTAR